MNEKPIDENSQEKLTQEQISKLNVYQKINKIMSEISYLKKTTKVGSGSYGYTALSHDHVTSSIQPLFVKYGIVTETSMTNTKFLRYEVTTKKGKSDRYETQCEVQVVIVNADKPEERFTVTSSAHGIDQADKSPGKAYSMATKYCLLKTLNLASGDDEEQRVEDAKIVSNERKVLEDVLKLLLKNRNKLDSKSIQYMNTLDLNGLREAISKYQNEENQ